MELGVKRKKEPGQGDHGSCSVMVQWGWEADVGDLGEEALHPYSRLISEARCWVMAQLGCSEQMGTRCLRKRQELGESEGALKSICLE